MTSKDRWIDEGMAVLREQGIDGVRVDRIAVRLGLTKGSFNHHFRGVGEYHRALLQRYERESVAMAERAVSQLADLSPQDALVALPAYVSFDARSEAAIRGWAFQDDEARAVLERVDELRLHTLIGLWRNVVADSTQARSAAMVPYLVMIGATVALPTPTDAEMRELFALLATLVPAVSA